MSFVSHFVAEIDPPLRNALSISCQRDHGYFMAFRVDEARIAKYFDEVIGAELRRSEQRVSFAAYALGLLGEGDRKSCEPIAARAAAGETEDERIKHARRGHDRRQLLLQLSDNYSCRSEPS